MQALISLLFFATVYGTVFPIDSNGNPKSGSIECFFVNPQQLWQNRDLYRLGKKNLNSQIKTIKAYTLPLSSYSSFSDAAILDMTVYTVTAKPAGKLPPSGNPHDFYSLSRYFWPNTANTSSTLYVRIDGQVNPEIYTIPDSTYFKTVKADVFKLSLTYFFLSDEKYALKATQRLRDFFINNTTRMNPNLNFGSWVIGSNPGILFGTGSGTLLSGGLLDMSDIYLVIDAIGILRGSQSFTNADYQGMVAWFTEYYAWTKTSARGLNEAARLNNLGVWFDGHQATVALFLGLTVEAAQSQQLSLTRLNNQIASNASEPLETVRADSWYYSIFNIRAHFLQIALSPSTGVSYATYRTSSGMTLLNALDYVVGYALKGGQGWVFPNSGNFATPYVVEMCREAYVVYKDVKYIGWANTLKGNGTGISGLSALWAPYNAYSTLTSTSDGGLGVRSGVVGAVVMCVLWGGFLM